MVAGLQEAFDESMMCSTPQSKRMRSSLLESSQSEVFIPSDFQRLQQMFPLLDNMVSTLYTFSSYCSKYKRSLINATRTVIEPTRGSWPRWDLPWELQFWSQRCGFCQTLKLSFTLSREDKWYTVQWTRDLTNLRRSGPSSRQREALMRPSKKLQLCNRLSNCSQCHSNHRLGSFSRAATTSVSFSPREIM